MSFYSLLIWNPDGGDDPTWNPGDYSHEVGSRVLGYVENAEKAVPASQTRKKEDFQWRVEYISEAVGRMSDGQDYPWWEKGLMVGNMSRVAR